MTTTAIIPSNGFISGAIIVAMGLFFIFSMYWGYKTRSPHIQTLQYSINNPNNSMTSASTHSRWRTRY